MSETTNPIGVSTPDNLYAGGFPEIRDTRTIPAGIAVKRGDILDEDLKPILSDNDDDIVDGVPDSIALEGVSATAAMRVITVAETGSFNGDALSTGDDKTAYYWKKALRKLCIYVRRPAP